MLHIPQSSGNYALLPFVRAPGADVDVLMRAVMNAQGVWQVSGMLLWFLWLPIITYNLHQQITMLHIIIRQPRPGHKLELQLQTSIRETGRGRYGSGQGRQRLTGSRAESCRVAASDVTLNAAQILASALCWRTLELLGLCLTTRRHYSPIV